jgi:hypothetical protein
MIEGELEIFKSTQRAWSVCFKAGMKMIAAGLLNEKSGTGKMS